MKVRTYLAMIVLPAAIALASCDSSHTQAALNTPLTLVNLNLLHGFDCDSPEIDTQQCRIRERIALLADSLVAAQCPDLITLQEVINSDFAPTAQGQPVVSILTLIEAQLLNLEAVCGFRYKMVYQPLLAVAISEVDEELILSRYPVLQTGTRVLYGPLYNEVTGTLVFARHVLHARIDHPSGEVDVYNTHLASGSDFATRLCDRDFCPTECRNSDTVRACQTSQLMLYVEQTRGQQNLALIAGDFNADPQSSEYQSIINHGWLDSHLAAGEDECNSATGRGCTSGRRASLQAIESPALNVTVRIDYIFVALPSDNTVCNASNPLVQPQSIAGAYAIESAGLFAGEPNSFNQACGSAPRPPCWISNHSGNHARVVCKR
ncbi:MAG: endonuclease/exonuclease/phosphatase family protein [Halioglobus sp.]|nr:endonuclease/exonuclease/phosphatase family protein [Halioglobus sp.]